MEGKLDFEAARAVLRASGYSSRSAFVKMLAALEGKKKEKTVSVGDQFISEDGTYMIVQTGGAYDLLILVNVTTGETWNNVKVKVYDTYHITAKEFFKMTGARYHDTFAPCPTKGGE